MSSLRLVALVLLASLATGLAAWGAEASNTSSARQQAAKDFQQRNFKDA
jgi:hypothetical protein